MESLQALYPPLVRAGMGLICGSSLSPNSLYLAFPDTLKSALASIFLPNFLGLSQCSIKHFLCFTLVVAAYLGMGYFQT